MFKTLLSAVVLSAVTASSAHAALVSLGNGTVKDTDTNLIWLQDWNLNGQKDWDTQKAWAEGLNFAGSTDWKLPEISEYRALISNYGALTAVSDFTNVQFNTYWSGTEHTAGVVAWGFYTFFNLGFVNLHHGQFYAVAVRPADAAASPGADVPEPQSLALALLALGATALTTRRRATRLQRCGSAA